MTILITLLCRIYRSCAAALREPSQGAPLLHRCRWMLIAPRLLCIDYSIDNNQVCCDADARDTAMTAAGAVAAKKEL